MMTQKTWFNLALAGLIVAVAAGLAYAGARTLAQPAQV